MSSVLSAEPLYSVSAQAFSRCESPPAMSFIIAPVLTTPLLKIPLLLSYAGFVYYGMTPPRAPPPKTELTRFSEPDLMSRTPYIQIPASAASKVGIDTILKASPRVSRLKRYASLTVSSMRRGFSGSNRNSRTTGPVAHIRPHSLLPPSHGTSDPPANRHRRHGLLGGRRWWIPSRLVSPRAWPVLHLAGRRPG